MAAELHTEGLQFILEAVFPKTQTLPTNYYLGLATDASLAEDATLASLTEVSGTGYSRQAIPASAVGFSSAAVGTNDWKVTGAQKTFSAGGIWTTANTWFLASSIDGTGKLIASGPLSQARTLGNGDTLNVTAALQLNG